MKMKTFMPIPAVIAFMVYIPSLHSRTSTPTAAAADVKEMEAQYKTCARHYIPADKCTPEVYEQLKQEESAPVDPDTAAAISAIKEYQLRLKNPESLQVRMAYVMQSRCHKCGPEDRTVCLEIGAQNSFGGPTVSHVALQMNKGKGRWFDGTGFVGGLHDRAGSDVWEGVCTSVSTPFHPSTKLWPGDDVTEKVNKVLKP